MTSQQTSGVEARHRRLRSPATWSVRGRCFRGLDEYDGPHQPSGGGNDGHAGDASRRQHGGSGINGGAADRHAASRPHSACCCQLLHCKIIFRASSANMHRFSCKCDRQRSSVKTRGSSDHSRCGNRGPPRADASAGQQRRRQAQPAITAATRQPLPRPRAGPARLNRGFFPSGRGPARPARRRRPTAQWPAAPAGSGHAAAR